MTQSTNYRDALKQVLDALELIAGPAYCRPDSVTEALTAGRAALAGVQVDADEQLDQALRERDKYHEIADDLAAQIAAITDDDIGEHSSSNDPWHNAMLAADEFIAKQLRNLLSAAHPQASEPARGEPAQGERAELIVKLREYGSRLAAKAADMLETDSALLQSTAQPDHIVDVNKMVAQPVGELTDEQICMAWLSTKDPLSLGSKFDVPDEIREFASAILAAAKAQPERKP